MTNDFMIRDFRPKRPPARCPECGNLAIEWNYKGEGYYLCIEPSCAWDGKLDASCDCCEAPMEQTSPVIAFGIETYACNACRNVEY